MLQYIFSKVLFLSAAGGGIILLLALTELWSRRRLSSRWNYYVWVFAVAALLLPVSYSPVTNMQDLSVHTPAALQTAQEGTQTDMQPAAGTANSPVQPAEKATAAVTADTPGTVPAEAEAVQPEEGRTARFDWRRIAEDVLPVAWAVAALLLLLLKLVQRVRFSAAMRRLGLPPTDVQLAALQQTAADMHVRRRIRLRCFCAESSPFVTGIFRPVIYIPQGMENPQELCLAFRHELTHCVRWDLLYKTVIDFLTALHFFNPLVYYMRSKVDAYCEFSCDEQVVRQMDAALRQQYGLMLLSRARSGRRLLGGSAALFEQKKTLKRRVEIIMKKRPVKRWTAMVSSVLAVVMGISCFALAGIVNAQNAAAPPAASYTSGAISNAHFFSEDGTAQERYGTLYLLRENGAAVTYTSFAGYTRFEASFFAMNAEGQTLTDTLPAEEGFAVFDDPAYYTDYYVVTLDRVLRRYGDGYGLEGLFTMTKNGEAVFEEQQGYLTNLPQGTGEDPYACLDVVLGQDGMAGRFSLNTRLTEPDAEAARHSRLRYTELERALDTHSVTLGRLLSSSIDGQEQDYAFINTSLADAVAEGRLWDNTSGTLLYNTRLQDADLTQPMAERIYILPYGSFSCTDDAISGDFILRTDGIDTDVFSGTISGLSNPVGGAATLRSDDGRYQASWEITEFVLEPLSVYGTLDPEGFYTEGEDVFIGTPYEQDQFDRSEHDRLYKRIIVDEAGKVLAVVPVELQTSEVLDNLDAQLREIAYGVSPTWQSLFNGSRVITASGEIRTETLVLQDPGTWWYRAVIPPENQYFEYK